jgi:hypothetical protein
VKEEERKMRREKEENKKGGKKRRSEGRKSLIQWKEITENIKILIWALLENKDTSTVKRAVCLPMATMIPHQPMMVFFKTPLI